MEMKNINKKKTIILFVRHTYTGRDNHFSKIKNKHKKWFYHIKINLSDKVYRILKS